VVDDYGDVFGVFIAVYGDEYSYSELKSFVDLMRRELLLVQDVAKIETFGERVEAIFVELDRDRIAQLGISEEVIIKELRQRNAAAEAGRVRVGRDYIALVPTGLVDDVRDFEEILISPGQEKQAYLKDVAEISRGYLDPPDHLLFYDGKPAIGLGISTVSGGNVVVMGEALARRAEELEAEFPLGIELGIISLQSRAVTQAIDGFTNSLAQAVAIVIVVLLFFMGLRSGLLIGFVLVLTIVGSFIFLEPWGVALERISLGALIIALGMLVDNAIVVVDGVLVRQQKGIDTKDAAIEVVKQSAIPLLGATVVAILAFAAIGMSDDKTGEFCRSLFQVVLVSLGFSWFTAVTITPLLCVMFLPMPDAPAKVAGEEEVDPYETPFYRRYKAFLRGCIRARWLSVGLVAGIFATAVWGFGYVDRSFFPPSTRSQFLLDLWLPQGTHIDETREAAMRIERHLREQEGVQHTTTTVARGGLRFLLTFTPEKTNKGYAQLIVDVEDSNRIDVLTHEVEAWVAEHLPDATAYGFRFELGPGANGKIRARFKGDDPTVLRRLANEAIGIFEADPAAKAIRTDWNDRVKIVQPVVADEQANLNGIRRPEIGAALQRGFDGQTVGVFRDGDLLLPIVMRDAGLVRHDIASLRGLQIWSPSAGSMIPLRQVVSAFETKWEDEMVWRRDRVRTITVFADPVSGSAPALFERLRPQVEAIELPQGFELEWGGEYEDSNDARAGIAAAIPLFVLLMILITIFVFDSLRQPLVIWLNVPLAIVGVTAGLLLTNQPFGFMSTLGLLSLIGMLIKNAVVLVDEINLQLSEGKRTLVAIVDSGASRLRPVAMAASTTALGMIPLLFDDFFRAMAVTIIGGLIFATVLTMVVLPVFYAIVFSVSSEDSSGSH